MATTDRVLTVEEAAALLRISKSAVYNLVAAGELEMVTVYGRTRRVVVTSIDAYLERQRQSS